MKRLGREIGVAMGLALAALAEPARAQEQAKPAPPPPNVWTAFQSTAPHETVAKLACTLSARAVVQGVAHPIVLEALEDGRELCGGTAAPDALRGRVQMTLLSEKQPTKIVVELDVPPQSTPAALGDIRTVLVNMAADLERRTSASAPAVVVGPPQGERYAPLPQGPTHLAKVANTPLIIGGAVSLGVGYFTSLIVGLAIVGADGDPGTGRFWPFVPFIGDVVFAASYHEAPNCDCTAGRVFSLLGGALLDAAQVAGVAMLIYGATHPRTRRVSDTVALHVGLGGAVLEGRF